MAENSKKLTEKFAPAFLRGQKEGICGLEGRLMRHLGRCQVCQREKWVVFPKTSLRLNQPMIVL